MEIRKISRGEKYDNLKIGLKVPDVLLLLCNMDGKFPVVWFQFLCTIHV